MRGNIYTASDQTTPTAMSATTYQRAAQAALTRYFADVRVEWSVVKDATDALAADLKVYAPRVDIAIGPFNVAQGRDERIDVTLLPPRFRNLFDGLEPNRNPRCLLAIEVVYSGSSKHVMGDMLNASALGLFGLVVGTDKMMPKVHRIGQYVERISKLEKSPELFANLASLSTTEFGALLTQN